MTTVLIIEDEKEIRRFVRIALESEGLKVFDAETLQRGLIEAATRNPIWSFSISACPMAMANLYWRAASVEHAARDCAVGPNRRTG